MVYNFNDVGGEMLIPVDRQYPEYSLLPSVRAPYITFI